MLTFYISCLKKAASNAVIKTLKKAVPKLKPMTNKTVNNENSERIDFI